MAMGTLSSLGFNSGVLTQETLDKLKKADEDRQIGFYTKRIETNTTKQKDLTELKTKLSTFQTSVSALANATAFEKRSVNASVTGDSAAASLRAIDGVALQNISVSVTQLAQKDVFQSEGFSSRTNRVLANVTDANGAAVTNTRFTLVQDGKTYTIAIGQNDTYEDFATKINDATGGKIVAKIVNTGEEPNPFRFTISSSETGTKNAISFVDGIRDSAQGATGYTTEAGASELLKSLGWELNKTDASGATITNAQLEAGKGFAIQDAQDPANAKYYISRAQNSIFSVDGVRMTRSSNDVTDIGAGLTLTLKQKGDINFDIKQDVEEVSKTMQELVDAYNDLMANVDQATRYDVDSGVAGSLQGVSVVTSLRSNIINQLFASKTVQGTEKDSAGNDISTSVRVSLQDFGLSLNESGTLSFKKSDFDTKVAKDVKFAEEFFAGLNGFEELNVTGEHVDVFGGAPMTLPPNSSVPGLPFANTNFKLVFNDKTYDLTKDKDGNDFTLTGNTAEERAAALLEHINSFNIEDLKVSFEKLTINGNEGIIFRFKSDNGSDFELSGDKTFLEKFGLKETKVSPELKEATGVFSDLKTTLQGMTGTKGTITTYDKELTADTKSLNAAKTQSQERIDARYETMAEQWSQYEVILSRYKTQLQSVTNMIDAMNSSKK